jgi:2-iminobutanoate/2-iminopropanoate deaminase
MHVSDEQTQVAHVPLADLAAGASALAPISAATVFGGLVVVSGQAAVDVSSGRLLADSIEEQAEITFAMLGQVLAEAGSSLADVLRCECYLARREDFAAFNGVFARTFDPPRPARTTLVSELVLDGMLVEVQAIAARRSPGVAG